jgi:exonuclease VII large subunit
MERAELAIDDSMDRISDRWQSESIGFAQLLEGSAADIVRMAGAGIERFRTSLNAMLDRLAQRSPSGTMRLAAGTIDHNARMMTARMRGDLSLRKKEISGRVGALAELDPRGVLRRGYSFCTTNRGTRVIPRAEKVSRGDEMTVHFYDGGVVCSVREKKKGRPWRKK